MRAWRAAVLAALVLLTAGCQVDIQVGVDVEPDGTGEVTVAAALDEAAAARVPALADQLEVDDLLAAGWTLTGPTPEADGRTWVRATKAFASPEEAGPVLDEISGADGPFRDLDVRRAPTLLRDEWHLTGTVDLRAGLAAFSDDALRARLDGTDVGLTPDELAAAAGRPLAQALTFRVAVVLPGEVTSNAPGRAALWRPVLGEQLSLVAKGSRLNPATVGWLAASGVAAVGALVLAVRGARRR